MNYYVGLISDVVNYVEDNIQSPLALDDLAHEFNVSAFHFNRIFRTVTGLSLKQYILGRKLTQAMQKLLGEGQAVIDVAAGLF
ncbi:MAG: AraC family transcriptional regulator [Anaerolineae bacterium]|nr:AraC family transcriptional regulator [Anaerolineae bacterium]